MTGPGNWPRSPPQHVGIPEGPRVCTHRGPLMEQCSGALSPSTTSPASGSRSTRRGQCIRAGGLPGPWAGGHTHPQETPGKESRHLLPVRLGNSPDDHPAAAVPRPRRTRPPLRHQLRRHAPSRGAPGRPYRRPEAAATVLRTARELLRQSYYCYEFSTVAVLHSLRVSSRPCQRYAPEWAAGSRGSVSNTSWRSQSSGPNPESVHPSDGNPDPDRGLTGRPQPLPRAAPALQPRLDFSEKTAAGAGVGVVGAEDTGVGAEHVLQQDTCGAGCFDVVQRVREDNQDVACGVEGGAGARSR